MILRQQPDPVKRFLDRATALFDQRHAELVEPLFLGELLAGGRRTATAWFRAGGISDEFRRAYTLLGTLGRSKVPACAALHHNPTPGPAQQKFLYGHIWVTTAWVVRHPQWHPLALPLLADLYIREKDLPKIAADRRPDFITKLELA